ncbi:hypothetical protein [Mammaliicoccus sciuri]|uniref:hypothetical protein n=1 Tax=Mammaliicoccus sciuri TaxID=1296 RepID=UPI0021D281CA|nr:hypothetical protein [Mammaliicoccus sciuri]UXU70168.1 hypothetical protein MUA36_05665 [Mammaliicoccus sciuri]
MEKDYLVGLIKFISPEYSNDFENNKLFFNDLPTFHRIEHEQIGDKLEGVISKKIGDEKIKNGVTMYYQVEDEPKVNSVQIDSTTIKITPDIINEMYINCFSKIMLSDLEVYEKNILKIKERYIERLKDIHDGRNMYVTIGGNKDRFLENITSYAKSNKLQMKGNIVNYYQNTHPMFDKIYNMNRLLIRDWVNGCFHKSAKYQNQNEYRLLFIGLKSNIVEIKNMYKDWIKVDNLNNVRVVTGTKEEVEKYLK